MLVWVLPALVHAFGVPGDLPWALRPDERFFLDLARMMVAGGDPSPHWFGHPGSTLIYPLAAIVALQQALGFDALAHAALAGRVLTATYAVLCFPLTHWIARRLFDTRVAALSVWLMLLAPYALEHATRVRTDSAGTFFVLLAFAACLRVHERASAARCLAAGAAVGLAIASRWFGAATAVLLVWALWGAGLGVGRAARLAGAGLAGALLAFGLSTPFALLEAERLLDSVARESLTTLLGADGLSPLGNLAWYLAYGLPRLGTGVHAALAAAGAVAVLARGDGLRRSPLVLVAVVVVGVSLHPLHWLRWLLPVFPLLCVLAAHALDLGASAAAARSRSPRAVRAAIFALVSLWPLGETALHLVRAVRPSTLLEAREWVHGHLPPGAVIVQESSYEPRAFNAPLDRSRFAVIANRGSLRCPPLLERTEPTWVMISAAFYRRVFAEPERHPERVACYERLFERADLVRSFPAGPLRGGPSLHVYRLPGSVGGRRPPRDLRPGRALSWRERVLFD